MKYFKTTTLAGVLLMAVTTAMAQPTIRANSVVNAASYLQPGLPNYGVAQGGMFILKGSGLGAKGIVVADAFPLPTTMGGTSMKITVAGTTVNVIMVYVVAGQPGGDSLGPFDQLAGIVPSTTPVGTGTITVTYNNQTSASAAITIVPSSFGIFSINQGGTGPGVFTDPNFKVNTLTAAAHAGDLLFIWGTGLGPISGNDAATPPVGDLSVPVEVYVGNVKADVTYKGRSGCCSGIDQILFKVPPGVQGCYVSVVVRTGNVVSNSTTVSIAPSGNVCSDATGFATSELQKAQSGAALTIADIDLARVNLKLSAGPFQGNVDFAEGHFRSYPPAAVLGSTRGSFAALPSFPSAGCIVYSRALKNQRLLDNISAVGSDASNAGLDAGPVLSITGPLGAKQIGKAGNAGIGNGFEYTTNNVLGGGGPPEYLAPGSYTVTNGSGAADVGGFTATLTIPSTSTVWTNQDAISNIQRSQDLTITWSGASSGVVAVEAYSANFTTQVSGSFFCTAAASDGKLTVPAWVLSALPATGGTASDVPVADAYLAVGNPLPAPTRFQVRGVDAGYFTWGTLQLKNVNYQ